MWLINNIYLREAFIVTVVLSTKKLSIKRNAHSIYSAQFSTIPFITDYSNLNSWIQMLKNSCLTGFCQKTFFYGHVYIEWFFIKRNKLPFKLQKHLNSTFFWFISIANAFCIWRNCRNIYNTSQNTLPVLMYVIYVALLLHYIILFAENISNVLCIFYLRTDLNIFVISLLFKLAELKLFLRSHIHCRVHICVRLANVVEQLSKKKRYLWKKKKTCQLHLNVYAVLSPIEWMLANWVYTLALSFVKRRKRTNDRAA